jgi:DNA-binding response OmpR family regulator
MGAVVRVLLIGDDPKELFEDALARIDDARFEVEWRREPVAALRTLREGRHEVCLLGFMLDFMLGSMGGLTFLREPSPDRS